jgi:predicted dehydrogenase
MLPIGQYKENELSHSETRYSSERLVNTPKAMAKINIGMISYEHIHAEFRSRALSEMRQDVQIVAVADDDEARGREAQRKFGGNYYSDYRELLKRDDLDLIFIHSANQKHKAMVLDTIQAGRALFCEKPIATNSADALEMTMAVEKSGLRNTVGFCSRYIPEAERAKQIVDQGLLGKLISVQAVIGLAGIKEIGCPEYMASWMEDPFLGGGGALIDEGAHAFDLLYWLIGDIEAVSCAKQNVNKPRLAVEDNAMTLVRFTSGALGSLSTLWSLNIDIGMRNTLQIFGTEGTMFVELTAKAPGIALYTEKGAFPGLGGWVTPHVKPAQSEPHDYLSWPTHVQHYKREVTDIISRFKSGSPFQTSFRDAYKVAQVTEAAYKASETNQFVSVQNQT